MLNINRIKIWVLTVIIFFTNYAFAANKIVNRTELKVFINIKEIIMEKPTEKYGDEVYFSITQYSNKKKPAEFRIPNFPLYWQSKYLDKIKDVNLWEGSLEKEESVQLIISLIEQDSPPFDPDDHLGSIKVVMLNNKGRLQINWEIPKLADQPEILQSNEKVPSFILKGDGGQYKVTFDVRQGK
jgi:hypothetical protein